MAAQGRQRQGERRQAGAGRIVGRIIRGPNCEIAVLDGAGNVAKKVEIPDGAGVYEIEWLQPGTYVVVIRAEGHAARELKGVKVRANQDLLLNIEFPVRKDEEREKQSGEKPAYEDNEKAEKEAEHKDAKKGEHGELVGVVVGKGEHFIKVKPVEGGPIESYFPRWLGGMPAEGGQLCPKTLEAIRRLEIGDRVALKWGFDERRRILAIKRLD